MSEFKSTSTANHEAVTETAASAQIPDSAYFQMLEHAKNFGTLPRVQAPSGTTWTKEDAINQPKELGARLEPPTAEVYIMDVLQRLGRDFELKSDLLRVKDLLAESAVYATSILDRVLKAEVDCVSTSAGMDFFWKDGAQYAPKELIFHMDEESILSFDQNGKILNPLVLRKYEKVWSCLSFSLAAHTLYGATGHFTPALGDKGAKFYPAQTVGVSDVLLVGAWGGCNSKTRGLTEKKVAALKKAGWIKFFEKVTSKQGGEGRDYIIISLEDDDHLRAAVAFDEENAQRSQMDEVMEFANKLQVVDRAQQYQADFMEEYDGIWTELERLKERVMSNPILNEPFVMASPDLTVPNFDEVDVSKLSPQMSLEQLSDALPSWEDHKDLLSKIAQMRIEVEAWEEFAPRFNNLQSAAQKLHGWLEIFGTYAELHLNCLAPLDRDVPSAPKEAFAFTEDRLLKCAQRIDQYLKEEANNREASTQLIGELLGNEKPVDNHTNPEEATQVVAVSSDNS